MFLFLKGEKDLFLNEEEPHLKQTILPPSDLSETRSELPQFTQTFTLAIFFIPEILSLFLKLYSIY